MISADWTQDELTIARTAFETGKRRSIEALIKTLQESVGALESPESIWSLHDYLSTERYQYEGRADFETSNILFTLADMLKQKLISPEELTGLDQKKLSKVKAMSMF